MRAPARHARHHPLRPQAQAVHARGEAQARAAVVLRAPGRRRGDLLQRGVVDRPNRLAAVEATNVVVHQAVVHLHERGGPPVGVQARPLEAGLLLEPDQLRVGLLFLLLRRGALDDLLLRGVLLLLCRRGGLLRLLLRGALHLFLALDLVLALLHTLLDLLLATHQGRPVAELDGEHALGHDAGLVHGPRLGLRLGEVVEHPAAPQHVRGEQAPPQRLDQEAVRDLGAAGHVVAQLAREGRLPRSGAANLRDHLGDGDAARARVLRELARERGLAGQRWSDHRQRRVDADAAGRGPAHEVLRRLQEALQGLVRPRVVQAPAQLHRPGQRVGPADE
mmetsp:Transcript_74116/g.226711  ORF Transcript_74116/g.226711 Transcript_74116/m.226711 type:complete len:335 (+) Transcript_74116:864-1868(+)